MAEPAVSTLEQEQRASETSHLLDVPTLHEANNDGAVDGEVITVEEAIETIGFGKFQLGILTYTGLAWLADAAEMILLSFIGPAAKCEWGLSAFGEGAISSSVFIGIFLGAYAWGIVSDIKGRRLGFLATAVFTFFFGMLSAWSPAYWFLLVARAFVGFGLGGSSVRLYTFPQWRWMHDLSSLRNILQVVFSLCMEFLPASTRGFWLVFMEVFWTVGSVAEALLAWLILPNYNWRILVGVSALPFLLLLILYPALPESPRYLMVKGDTEGAWKVLRQVARINGAPVPRGTLSLAQSLHQGSKRHDQVLPSGVGRKTYSDKETSTKPPESRGALKTFMLLFSPELKVTTLLSWTFFFANAFTYYGLVLLTTQLPYKSYDDLSTVKVACLPDGKPGTDVSSYKAVLITCLAELPGLLVACLIVERFGRKASLGALLFACGFFVIPLWTPLSQVATNTLMFGARSCIMGAFSILWAFAPELYPTKVRSTGLGFCNSGGRVGGFLCPFVAVGLMESGHRVLSVTLFSLVPLIASMGSFLFPVETKGQRLADDVEVEKPAMGVSSL